MVHASRALRRREMTLGVVALSATTLSVTGNLARAGVESASGVPARRSSNKLAPTPWTPRFTFWTPASDGGHPFWDHPQMEAAARVVMSSINNHKPPGYPDIQVDGFPTTEQIAERAASWFEFQGYTRGSGSEHGGLYEGAITLQGWGVGLNPRGGKYQGSFNLALHVNDGIDRVQNPSCIFWWGPIFHARGVAEGLTHRTGSILAPALRARFDALDLCYPGAVHMDLEVYAVPWEAVAGLNGTLGGPAGWFTAALADARAQTEILYQGKTLSDLYGEFTGAGGTYTDTTSCFQPPNHGFTVWFYPTALSALSEGSRLVLYDPLRQQFPLTRISNYDSTNADDPERPYVYYSGASWQAWNQTYMNEELQAPVLYPPNIAGHRLPGELPNDTYVRHALNNVDACLASSSGKGMVAWVPGPGTLWSGYLVTEDDVLRILRGLVDRGISRIVCWHDPGISDFEPYYVAVRRITDAMGACPADYTLDGRLDVADLLRFLNVYTNGSPRADFNRDGVPTVQDFLAFLEAFAEGCQP